MLAASLQIKERVICSMNKWDDLASYVKQVPTRLFIDSVVNIRKFDQWKRKVNISAHEQNQLSGYLKEYINRKRTKGNQNFEKDYTEIRKEQKEIKLREILRRYKKRVTA